MQHRAGLEEKPRGLQHMETDSLKGPLVHLITVLGGERAGRLLRTGWREASESGALRKLQKERNALTGDILEPIRDQRKRGNLCIGQRKRNSLRASQWDALTHHRSCEERRSHRTETPDAGATFQERGGGRRQTDTHGPHVDSAGTTAPGVRGRSNQGCVHGAGPGKPDAGWQTWNYSDDQRDRRHQDDKVAGPGPGPGAGGWGRGRRGTRGRESRSRAAGGGPDAPLQRWW